MKVISIKEQEEQVIDKTKFPFFAKPKNNSDCVVMFIDNVKGLAIKHNVPSYVGKISDWVPLNTHEYWVPYHGQITIEV